MKSTLIIALILVASITAQAQNKKHKADSVKAKPATTKTDTTKKARIYTLFLNVDSASYIQVLQSIRNVQNALEASKAPHDEVQADQMFLMQLNNLFVQEKKAQEKPLPKTNIK